MVSCCGWFEQRRWQPRQCRQLRRLVVLYAQWQLRGPPLPQQIRWLCLPVEQQLPRVRSICSLPPRIIEQCVVSERKRVLCPLFGLCPRPVGRGGRKGGKAADRRSAPAAPVIIKGTLRCKGEVISCSGCAGQHPLRARARPSKDNFLPSAYPFFTFSSNDVVTMDALQCSRMAPRHAMGLRGGVLRDGCAS